MIVRALLASVLAGALGACWWIGRCERDCAAAEVAAQSLFDRGDALGTLGVIDSADARCRCSRFTAGDAPALYSLAQACLRKLADSGRTADASRLLAGARGPILQELAKAGR